MSKSRRKMYYSDQGPIGGPHRTRAGGHAIEVHDKADCRGRSVGTALPMSWIRDVRGPVSTFRLTLGKAPLNGLWVLVGRQSIPAEEWKGEPPDEEDGPGA